MSVVIRICHLDEIQREQNGVKIESPERFEINFRSIRPVTCDADILGQSFLTCFLERLQRAAFHSDGVQFFHLCDRVTLIQVEALCLQTLEGLLQLIPCTFLCTLHRLAAEEEATALARHPRTD